MGREWVVAGALSVVLRPFEVLAWPAATWSRCGDVGGAVAVRVLLAAASAFAGCCAFGIVCAGASR